MRMWRYGSRGSNVPRPTRPSPTPFSRTSSEGDRLPSEEKLAERISGLRDQAVEQEARQFGAFANTARNSPQTVNCVVVDAARIEPVSSLHFGQMQGDFRKMQGGGGRNLAETQQISIAWDDVSLLKRAGRSREHHFRLAGWLLANHR